MKRMFFLSKLNGLNEKLFEIEAWYNSIVDYMWFEKSTDHKSDGVKCNESEAGEASKILSGWGVLEKLLKSSKDI